MRKYQHNIHHLNDLSRSHNAIEEGNRWGKNCLCWLGQRLTINALPLPWSSHKEKWCASPLLFHTHLPSLHDVFCLMESHLCKLSLSSSSTWSFCDAPSTFSSPSKVEFIGLFPLLLQYFAHRASIAQIGIQSCAMYLESPPHPWCEFFGTKDCAFLISYSSSPFPLPPTV